MSGCAVRRHHMSYRPGLMYAHTTTGSLALRCSPACIRSPPLTRKLQPKRTLDSHAVHCSAMLTDGTHKLGMHGHMNSTCFASEAAAPHLLRHAHLAESLTKGRHIDAQLKYGPDASRAALHKRVSKLATALLVGRQVIHRALSRCFAKWLVRAHRPLSTALAQTGNDGRSNSMH